MKCNACNGTGNANGKNRLSIDLRRCTRCGGSGQVNDLSQADIDATSRPTGYGNNLSQVKTASKPRRVPVDFRYDALNPSFLKMLARIGAYADQKYGSWSQYTGARLTGEKSPINHIYEHLRAYVQGERYDHFDGDPRWHLVAVAYNAMMEYWYHSKWGHEKHPLALDPPELSNEQRKTS